MQKIEFTKMHGLGNDFVIIEAVLYSEGFSDVIENAIDGIPLKSMKCIF